MTVIGAVSAEYSYSSFVNEHRESLPDGFLNGKETSKLFVLIMDRIPYGLLRFDQLDDKSIFAVSFDQNTSEENKQRMIAFVSEFLIRKHHASILYSPHVTEMRAFRANGYYPKGRGMQKVVEPWRKLLEDRVFDDEGYIINQGLMKSIPYGWFDTQAKGCGWIAAYNLLKMNGMETTMEECVRALEKRVILGGVMGSEEFMVMTWLRKKGLKVKMSLPSNAAARKAAAKSSSGILLYTQSRGGHYTAYRKLANGNLQFYNAVYGRRYHEVSCDDFLKNYALFPVSSVIYVENRND